MRVVSCHVAPPPRPLVSGLRGPTYTWKDSEGHAPPPARAVRPCGRPRRTDRRHTHRREAGSVGSTEAKSVGSTEASSVGSTEASSVGSTSLRPTILVEKTDVTPTRRRGSRLGSRLQVS